MKPAMHGGGKPSPTDFYCRTPCSFQLPGMMFSPGKLAAADPVAYGGLRTPAVRSYEKSKSRCLFFQIARNSLGAAQTVLGQERPQDFG